MPRCASALILVPSTAMAPSLTNPTSRGAPDSCPPPAPERSRPHATGVASVERTPVQLVHGVVDEVGQFALRQPLLQCAGHEAVLIRTGKERSWCSSLHHPHLHPSSIGGFPSSADSWIWCAGVLVVLRCAPAGGPGLAGRVSRLWPTLGGIGILCAGVTARTRWLAPQLVWQHRMGPAPGHPPYQPQRRELVRHPMQKTTLVAENGVYAVPPPDPAHPHA